MPTDSPEWKRDVGFFLNNIRRIIQLCRVNNIDIVVTTYPHRQQLEHDLNGTIWHRQVEYNIQKLCADENVLFFSAFNGIQEAFLENPEIYWQQDMHFTPEGQRIWADLISVFVLDNILKLKHVHSRH